MSGVIIRNHPKIYPEYTAGTQQPQKTTRLVNRLKILEATNPRDLEKQYANFDDKVAAARGEIFRAPQEVTYTQGTTVHTWYRLFCWYKLPAGANFLQESEQ